MNNQDIISLLACFVSAVIVLAVGVFVMAGV
jgi:hypothetical protein